MSYLTTLSVLGSQMAAGAGTYTGETVCHSNPTIYKSSLNHGDELLIKRLRVMVVESTVSKISHYEF